MDEDKEQRAVALHVAGMELEETGHEDAAIEQYLAALVLDPERPDTLYNLGLIHKYRGAWRESLDFNRRADAVRPGDEATLWNLAIAATALRDWRAARGAWAKLGIEIPSGDGPINGERGRVPVRLNADNEAGLSIEVVWSQALCPVRSRILNIPTAETGFRYGDIVLHDGAPVGYRLNRQGREVPVFNVLELFVPSPFATCEASIEMASHADFEALEAACEAVEMAVEDWTASLRNLCKACSEGRPHEGHDHELKESDAWERMRRVAFGVEEPAKLKALLDGWAGSGERRVVQLECTLEGGVTHGAA